MRAIAPGRRAEVRLEQAAQLPLADAQLAGERGDVAPVEVTLSRSAASARATTADPPSHSGVPGAVSGRQRRHGRSPAASAAAAVG